MTVATEPIPPTAAGVDPIAIMIARLDRMERILHRVEALLDAVDRHPVARRWLGLP